MTIPSAGEEVYVSWIIAFLLSNLPAMSSVMDAGIAAQQRIHCHCLTNLVRELYCSQDEDGDDLGNLAPYNFLRHIIDGGRTARRMITQISLQRMIRAQAE